MRAANFASTLRDVTQLRALWLKWVSPDGPVDPLRLQAVIKRELSAAESGRIHVSPGLITEMRNERAIVGRIINARTVNRITDAGKPGA